MEMEMGRVAKMWKKCQISDKGKVITLYTGCFYTKCSLELDSLALIASKQTKHSNRAVSAKHSDRAVSNHCVKVSCTEARKAFEFDGQPANKNTD